MLPVKNNLAADVLGLAYTIEPSGPNGAPVVAWESEPVSLSADDALAADRDDRDDGDDAADFLREALAYGEQPAADVLKQPKANGFADKATRKAFKAAGGKRRRIGFGAAGAWYWSLPRPIVAIDAQPKTMANNGNNGGEWAELSDGGLSSDSGPADPDDSSDRLERAAIQRDALEEEALAASRRGEEGNP